MGAAPRRRRSRRKTASPRQVRRQRGVEAPAEPPGVEPAGRPVEPVRRERERGAPDRQPDARDDPGDPTGLPLAGDVVFRRRVGERPGGADGAGAGAGREQPEQGAGGRGGADEAHADQRPDGPEDQAARPAVPLEGVQPADAVVPGRFGSVVDDQHRQDGRDRPDDQPQRRVGGDDRGDGRERRDDRQRDRDGRQRRQDERATPVDPVGEAAERDRPRRADERRRRREIPQLRGSGPQLDDIQRDQQRGAAERGGAERPRVEPAVGHRGVVRPLGNPT